MKKISVLTLAVVTLLLQSFKPAENVSAPIQVQVNGKNFQLHAANSYEAQLNKNKTATICFTGADLRDKDGYAQSQKLNISYQINEVGDILAKGISYELDGKKFESAAGETTMSVSQFDWSADKKSFVISASFSCAAQSQGPFQANHDAIHIQGHIQNIQVELPGHSLAAAAE